VFRIESFFAVNARFRSAKGSSPSSLQLATAKRQQLKNRKVMRLVIKANDIGAKKVDFNQKSETAFRDTALHENLWHPHRCNSNVPSNP